MILYNHNISLKILHIIAYHIVDIKRQNRLKVETDQPTSKMQSVSDDDTAIDDAHIGLVLDV